MSGHKEIIIEEFNGLWARGDADSCPLDHFVDNNNISFIQGGFRTRDGLNTYFDNNLGIGDIVRMYTFVQETGQSILALDIHNDIYDVQGTSILGPIIHVAGMTDFGFVSLNGRAYISPSDGLTGLANEFIYVYKGDGSSARKAGGVAPVDADGIMVAVNSGIAGDVETGVHIFGV